MMVISKHFLPNHALQSCRYKARLFLKFVLLLTLTPLILTPGVFNTEVTQTSRLKGKDVSFSKHACNAQDETPFTVSIA